MGRGGNQILWGFLLLVAAAHCSSGRFEKEHTMNIWVIGLKLNLFHVFFVFLAARG
jgi:hypothetical protein